MATPVGHSLLGVTCALFLRKKPSHSQAIPLYLLAIFAANFPDFDFLPGLLVGNINQFHQGPSHSLFAALLFGGACMFLYNSLKISAWSLALLGFTAYTSHLLLDMLCHDSRAPFGIPLLWPIYNEHLISPVTLFSGVRHGVPGDSFMVFLSNVFSLTNLKTVAIESGAVLPLLLLAHYVANKSRVTQSD
jgi:membrane-bound metal-dependent hydrolase YbcI (DUF457 family)